MADNLLYAYPAVFVPFWRLLPGINSAYYTLPTFPSIPALFSSLLTCCTRAHAAPHLPSYAGARMPAAANTPFLLFCRAQRAGRAHLSGSEHAADADVVLPLRPAASLHLFTLAYSGIYLTALLPGRSHPPLATATPWWAGDMGAVVTGCTFHSSPPVSPRSSPLHTPHRDRRGLVVGNMFDLHCAITPVIT